MTGVTAPSCGLVGCDISEELQNVVEQGYRLLPGGIAPAPPPPPAAPEPWWQSGWLLLALLLLAGAVALIVRRSPRLQELLRGAVGSTTTHAGPAATMAAASVRRQAQPAQVSRWSVPLGHLTMRAARATGRWIRRGKGGKGKGLRAAGPAFAMAYLILSPFGVAMLPVTLVAMLPLWVFLFVGLVVAVAMVARRAGSDEDTAAWWSERKLLTALRSAGIVPALRADEPEVSLRRRGAPQHSEHGTAVVFELPGQPWTLVRDRADRLAAALRLDGDRLHVSHPEGTPTGTVKLFVGNLQREGSTPAEVGSAERTRWSEPVRIGMDPQGQPVHLQTSEANTLLAGQPGAGKTSVARIVLSHFLLDSTAAVYLLDGKGSRRDYGAAVPLCARFVSGTDESSVEDTEEMLGEVLAIVRQRNAASGDGPAPGGVLLLLEEFQDVRAAADKGTRDRLDNLLGRVVRMGRAVGVSVLVSTQRPSVDDLPSGTRNLIGQRVALMLRNAADAALVLGTPPTLPLPARRGQALLTTPTGTVSVALDLLDADAWTSLCSRATTARSYAVGAPRSPFARPLSVDPVEPAEPASEPLLDAVVDVLRDAHPAGITASALHTALPVWVRPDTPARLGMALRPHLSSGDTIRRAHVGKAVVIRLAVPGAPPAGVPGESPVSPRQVPGPGGPGTSSPPLHAQPGASVTQSPESPAGAR